MCQPFRKAFDVTVEAGKCVDPVLLNIVIAFWNQVTDVAVLLLTVHEAKWWQCSRVEKWGLSGIIALGFVYVARSGRPEHTQFEVRLDDKLTFCRTVLSSVMRAVYLFQALHSNDITWEMPNPCVWT